MDKELYQLICVAENNLACYFTYEEELGQKERDEYVLTAQTLLGTVIQKLSGLA